MFRRPGIFSVLCTAMVLAVVLSISQASAQNLVRSSYGKKHRASFGLKAGVLNTATFKYDDHEIDTDYGIIIGVLFDFPVTSWSMLGVTADILDIKAMDERHKALDVGFTMKFPIYRQNRDFVIRPGFGVGYGYLAHVAQAFEASDYMTTKVFVEGVVYSKRRYAFLLDLGVLYTPIGGSSEYDEMRYGPVVYFRIGVIY
jgi:hypothetical protein